MGACCTATNKHERRSSNRNSTPNIKVEEIPDDASIVDEGKPRHGSNNPVQQYLRSGNTRGVQELIDRKEIIVNDYIYGGSDKTILHEAVQISDSDMVIETILNNRADVNAVEKETGNTALILAALDLKVDIVKTILKFNPNIRIRNRKGQDIFVFLNDYLVEKKGTKKTDLTPEQSEKLHKIIDMLKDYKNKSESIENLDEDERKEMNPAFNDSGNMRNRDRI